MSSVKDSVHLGLKWMAVSMAATRAFQFISVIVLARLLSKEEFGIVIAAMMIIQILRVFGEMGLQDAFIQRKETERNNDTSAANTLFVLTTASNGLLFCLGMLLADQVATWFSKVEGLEPVLRWLFTMLLLDSVASTATAILRKRLDFSKVSQCEISYAATYIVVAISLALQGYGVWSMVSGHIAARLVQTIYLLINSGWKPRFQFDLTVARSIMGVGVYLWGFAVLSAVGSQLAQGFTATLLGSVSIGIYGISLSLCTLPANQIAYLVNQISFPAMAQMQSDLARLQGAFLKALSLVCLLAIPLATGLFLVAEDLIPVVYSNKWHDAIPVIRILAFYGMVLAIASTTNPILVALGKVKHMLYTGILAHSLLFIALWLVADQGLEEVAWAVLISLLLGSAVAFLLIMHHVKIRARQIIDPIFRTGLAAAIMAATVEIFQNAMASSFSHLPMLLMSIALGAAVFAAASLMVNRTITLDFIRTLLSVVSSRSKPMA